MEPPTVTPESSSAATDRAALIALYSSTDGPNWRNNRRWLSDAPIEKWVGVVTDHDGRVIQLFLPNNQLTGEIPAELGSITSLEWLWLQNNQLTGEIPAELGSLTKLEQLWISENQLTGAIPEELGNLTNLEGLGLGHNQLTGAIPEELGNLTYLDNLRLQANQLTGEIPAQLGILPNLKWLSLNGNQLRGCLPILWRYVFDSDVASLGLPFCRQAPPMLPAADKANLVAFYDATGGPDWENSRNWLSDVPPLGYWNGVTTDRDGRVTQLWFQSNRLTGEIPTAELLHFIELERLRLAGNQLTGVIPPELGNFTNLEVLVLDDNQLTGGIPPELGYLTNVEELWLAENQLTGVIPAELGNLTNLEELVLDDNKLTGEIPVDLAACPRNTVGEWLGV